MNNPQGKRLIPEYLLKYLEEVKNTYPEASKIVSKKYEHYINFSYSQENYIIKITNSSQDDLTSDDILGFIRTLPINALYPILTVIPSTNNNLFEVFHSVRHVSGGGSDINIVGYRITYNKDTNVYTSSERSISIFGSVTINSQYYLEV